MGIYLRYILVTVLFANSAVTLAQHSNKTTKAASTPAPTNQPKSATSPKDTAAIVDSASNALSQLPSAGADYIPCRFTYAELKELNAPEQVLTLSPADAESLVEKVTSTIQEQQTAGLISAEVEQALLAEITKSKLTGKTPSEALQTIIQATLEARKAVAAQAAQGKAGPPSSSKSPTPPSVRSPVPRVDTPSGAPDHTSGSGDLTEPETSSPGQVQKTDTVTVTGEKTVLIPGAETSQSIAPIINSARNTIERLSRPPDIGCAMSVLSYNETSKAFGYIIANNYIGVQVVVRNLNRDQQFVLHDVEYSINSDPTGTPGRFYSGRDKIVVRALASAEGSFDPRNFIVHGAQGLGALLTTLVPIYGGAIGAASAVYNGGFFPALDKVWKDMSTDQLNLLNDTGFSSSSSSQTVVPKAATVMFVTFIPSKQFERGWWTQDCVTSTPLGTISNHQIKALIPLTVNSHAEASAETVPIDEAIRACAYQAFKKVVAQPKAGEKAIKPASNTGVTIVPGRLSTSDLTKALPRDPDDTTACADISAKAAKDESALSSQEKETLAGCEEPAMLYASVPKRLFRHWNGNSLALFEELSTVVVAGMHIVDEKDLQPTLTSVDCTKDSAGEIIFPTPDTGSIVCPIKGKNLSKVKSLRLRNTDESGYTDGGVNPASGDDTSGTVTFNSGALHALDKSDYAVTVISPTSVETGTTQFLHFDLLPYVSKTDPAALDAESLNKNPLFTISGYHLDKVAEVHFYLQDPKTAAVFKVTPETPPTGREIKITLSATEVAKLGKTAGDTKWSFILASTGKELVIPTTLKYTPASAAPATVNAPRKAPGGSPGTVTPRPKAAPTGASQSSHKGATAGRN
jgi:hypothetical protein